MWIKTSSQRERENTRLSGAIQTTRQDPYTRPVATSDEEVSWFDAAVASAKRENTVISGLAYLNREDADHGHVASSFNPYSYLAENFDDDKINRLYTYIDDDMFSDIRSAESMEAKIKDWEKEIELKEAMSGAHWSAAFIGGAAGAIFDPINFVPYANVVARGRTLGRGAQILMNTAASVTASEAALQYTQDARTASETILNIGIGTAIGGGIGLFAKVSNPRDPLHPRHPDNPLRRDRVGKRDIIEEDGLGNSERFNYDDRATLGNDGAMGAARTEEYRPGDSAVIGSARQQGRVEKAIKLLPNILRRSTPAGRAGDYVVDEARQVLMRIYDTPLATEGNKAGRSSGMSAEAYKNAMIFEWQAPVVSEIRRQAADYKTARKGKDRLNDEDFRAIVLRELELKGEVDPRFNSHLVAKYGQEAIDAAKPYAAKAANSIHEANAEVSKVLVEKGYLYNEKKATYLKNRQKAAAEELEAAKKAGVYKGKLDAIRERRDTYKREFEAESRKDRPLGKDYGLMQQWDADAIILNQPAAKAFFNKVVARRPDEDWLEETYQMRIDEFDNLKAEDPIRHDEILADWVGDAWHHRVDRLETQLKAAEEEKLLANLNLQDAAQSLGMMKANEANLTPKIIRKRRDAINAELAQRKSQRDLERARLHRENATSAKSEAETRLTEEWQQDVGTYTNKKTERSARDRAAGKRELANKDVERMTSEITDITAKVDKLNRALADYEASLTITKEGQKNVKVLMKAAKDELGVQVTTVKKLKKELAKLKKTPPMFAKVEKLIENLTTTGRLSGNDVDIVGGTSGRLKSRSIHLDNELKAEAWENGFLSSNLMGSFQRGMDDITSDLALHHVLDVGPNGKFKSVNDVKKSFSKNYLDLIAEGTEQGANKADLDKLDVQRKQAEADFDLGVMRVKKQKEGTDHTRTGILKWMSQKARASVFIRHVGGFWPSTLSDVASYHLNNGSFFRDLYKFGRPMAKALKDGIKNEEITPGSLRFMLAGMERTRGQSTVAARLGADDVTGNSRIGARGVGEGMTRKVTSGVDKATDTASDFFAQLSLLPAWTSGTKTMSAFSFVDKIRRAGDGPDFLTPFQRTHLANVGMGTTELTRAQALMRKHGSEGPDGIFDPGLEHWPLDDRLYFSAALQRNMDRSTPTPGIGDAPRVFDNEAVALVTIFQRFALAFMNKTILPMAQRMGQGDRQAFMSMATLFMAATSTVILKDLQKGKDPMERFSEENALKTTHEILDRSGVMGWMATPVSALLQARGFGGASRYAQREWYSQLLGPAFGQMEDVSEFGALAGHGDPDALVKAWELAPFEAVFKNLNMMSFGTLRPDE